MKMNKIILILVLVLSAMIITSCDEFENSWEGKYKGIITITNDSSYSLHTIKIWKYSDGSGDKIEDKYSIESGSSRTYQNEAVFGLTVDSIYTAK